MIGAHVKWIRTGTKNDCKELATHAALSVCLTAYRLSAAVL